MRTAVAVVLMDVVTVWYGDRVGKSLVEPVSCQCCVSRGADELYSELRVARQDHVDYEVTWASPSSDWLYVAWWALRMSTRSGDPIFQLLYNRNPSKSRGALSSLGTRPPRSARGAPRELTTGGEWRGCGMYFLPTYPNSPQSSQGFCKLQLLLPSPLLDLGSTGAGFGFCVIVVVAKEDSIRGAWTGFGGSLGFFEVVGASVLGEEGGRLSENGRAYSANPNPETYQIGCWCHCAVVCLVVRV
ncbi:uncharacterized protein BDZ83DRAFT_655924 [Colletotrichum acutatum]|uniref:Uncharacterized protein n=1 Tax=Glomerella acutata TaxID=27357 RepID=A0AAD8UE89_GLOAC|nr:uncharacterized protein BDZ83DRAFT_655924 [Colletotrichum acutatum]KAK1714991.1 hypothetical protein BDZ83DRAFT_655924 [Colletotrichum acutatum]